MKSVQDEQQLKTYFRRYGEVESVEVRPEKCIVFVRFLSLNE